MIRQKLAAARAHEPIIVAVLLLTLGLTGALAYQAQSAAHSHRQSAEAALRDYAAFASWGLARHLEEAVDASLTSAVLRGGGAAEIALITGAARAHDAENLDRFRAELSRALIDCDCVGALDDFFALDLRTGQTARSGSTRPAAFDDWLGAVVGAEARADTLGPTQAPVIEWRDRPAAGSSSIDPIRPGGLRIESTGPGGPEPGGPRTSLTLIRPTAAPPHPFRVRELESPGDVRLVYTILRDRQGEPSGAYGFVLDVAAFTRPIAREVVARADLLPPSLTRGRPNDDVLAVRISTESGAELFRSSAPVGGPTHVVDTVAAAAGLLVTDVAIRPEAAATLLIGGLPRSRLPLLLPLVLLTLALILVATVQLRRQQALTRLRADFVAGVSHEIRTPLAQISLFGQLLELGRLRPDQESRSIRIINDEAQRLTHLVDNILQFSRTDRHENQILAEPTPVGPVVRSIVDRFAPLARTRDASLDLDVVEDITAPVDQNALRQILLNLLDNAVKYGPPGQLVRVRVAREESFLRISVEDEGPGVPAGDRARVWDPYCRLDRDAESATGGSGIGLSVVRDLVHLHGGSVAIEDGPTGGARVVVRLPAFTAAVPGDVDPEPHPAATARSPV
jgi:signal transduction histidine kinase